MIVLKMSFVRYECLRDVFGTLWMSQKMSFVRYECLKDVFRTYYESEKVLNEFVVFQTSLVFCYGYFFQNTKQY